MCFLYLHLPLVHTPHTTMCSSGELTGTHSLFRLYIFTVLLLPETKQTKNKPKPQTKQILPLIPYKLIASNTI